MEEFTQALGDAQAAGEPVVDIVAAMTDGETTKTEIIEGKGIGQLIGITEEPEVTETLEAIPEAMETSVKTKMRLENNELSKKPAHKGKEKKGAVATEDAGK